MSVIKMGRGILGILLICASYIVVQAQEEDNLYAKSYYFDGDDVVFEFDSRYYTKATKDGTSRRVDFEDLDIREVIVSGSFNNWSKKGWKMRKVGQYTYQLRKPVKNFNDAINWEFKFLINNRYWAEPGDRFKNRVPAEDFWQDVYNLNIYNVEADPNGNVEFFLEGHINAQQVILAGTFNGWHEQDLKMRKTTDGWSIRLDLSPGRYEYKFIIDGQWTHDPENPQLIANIHGTYNSILFIEKEVVFQVQGYLDAQNVILAGSFNNWNEQKAKMEKTDFGWRISRKLSGGKHLYKFIIDGKWITDPTNPLKERDRDGNTNSVLLVQ